MPKIEYVPCRFRGQSKIIINAANVIIDEYLEMGFTLTLRQLYYQFVSRDLIPNKQVEYKKLGNIINNARLAGLVDWDAIIDRTRNVQTNPHWNGPADILATVSRQYKIDMWDNQLYRPEVWIEKDALIGVIENICTEFDVPYFSCRGYNSQSEQWRAGQRFSRTINNNQIPIVLHLGDHDPSGIDMTRDNADRLFIFTRFHKIEVNRLALNMGQVQQYKPPPNPAETSDPRFQKYTAAYGSKSWELDALEPQVIEELIRVELEKLINGAAWEKRQINLKKEKFTLQKLREYWNDVEDFLSTLE